MNKFDYTILYAIQSMSFVDYNEFIFLTNLLELTDMIVALPKSSLNQNNVMLRHAYFHES